MSHNKAITVHVAGSLKNHIASDTTLHNVHTVGEAITHLNLPTSGELVILVNERIAYWQTELADGDVLKLIPAISGGQS